MVNVCIQDNILISILTRALVYLGPLLFAVFVAVKLIEVNGVAFHLRSHGVFSMFVFVISLYVDIARHTSRNWCSNVFCSVFFFH